MSDLQLKHCKGSCGLDYPATSEYFHKNKATKDGLFNMCKTCRNAQNKSHYERPGVKEHKKAQYKERYSNPEIRAHKLKQGREHYHRPEVKERVLERQKSYRSRPEVKKHAQERSKEYRSRPEVRQRSREQKREYLSRNDVIERRRANNKRYLSIPSVVAQRRINLQNYLARKRSIMGSHTHEQIQQQIVRQKHKCYYCQKRLQKVKGKYIYHIEHTFPVSRVAGTDIPANSIDYIVLACPACNFSKHDKFPWEWPEGGRLL